MQLGGTFGPVGLLEFLSSVSDRGIPASHVTVLSFPTF
jgi:hypothetical protein